MKKIVVVMIALFLALPAMSYAGSATSRFDMTIGGNVNFNFGYSNNDVASDSFHSPMRESSATATNLNAERGRFGYNVQDSQINFLSRGPDAFGAKTMGFLQIDFRAGNTGNQVGGAQIQYAFVKFDWANSYLVMGKAGPEVLSAYARKFIIAGDASSTEGVGGIRALQIAYRQKFAKNFNIMAGVIQHTDQTGGAPGAQMNNNGYGRSQLPAVQTEFGFESDACGKIGPDALKFGLGAIAGKEYRTIWNAASSAANTYNDKTLNAWMVGLRTFIPIIPEKKENKGGALAFSGIGYIGQNAWPWLGTPAPGVGSYWRNASGNAFGGLPSDAASPTMYGGFLQLTYYINNETYMNAQYGVLKQNYSSVARNTVTAAGAGGAMGPNEVDWKGPNMTNQFRVYGASIFHDPCPSIRLGLEWLRMVDTFNGYGTGSTPGTGPTAVTVGTGNLDSHGRTDQYKAMVMYFF